MARKRGGLLTACLLTLPAVLALFGGALRAASVPSIIRTGWPSASRRDTLLAAAVTGLLPPLAAAPVPARAEQAWQLRLPRTWRTFSQTPAPPPDVKRPTALVVAGNPELGGELVVLRVPLPSDPKDPNAAASADLVRYFATPSDKKPSVKIEKVVDAVAQSQKTSPGLIKFGLLGSPFERTAGGRRYVRYEYEASLCQGLVQKGVNGDQCTRPETGEDLLPFNRRHAITLTVTPEDTSGASRVDYLWLLDVSGPLDAEGWKAVSEQVETASQSFELGSEEQLERDRTAEITPEQLEALKELQKAGLLPQDRGV